MFSPAFHRDLATVLDRDCPVARERVLAHAQAHGMTSCTFPDAVTGKKVTFKRRAGRATLRATEVQNAVLAYFRAAEAAGAEPSAAACADAATGATYEVVVRG